MLGRRVTAGITPAAGTAVATADRPRPAVLTRDTLVLRRRATARAAPVPRAAVLTATRPRQTVLPRGTLVLRCTVRRRLAPVARPARATRRRTRGTVLPQATRDGQPGAAGVPRKAEGTAASASDAERARPAQRARGGAGGGVLPRGALRLVGRPRRDAAHVAGVAVRAGCTAGAVASRWTRRGVQRQRAAGAGVPRRARRHRCAALSQGHRKRPGG